MGLAEHTLKHTCHGTSTIDVHSWSELRQERRWQRRQHAGRPCRVISAADLRTHHADTRILSFERTMYNMDVFTPSSRCCSRPQTVVPPAAVHRCSRATRRRLRQRPRVGHPAAAVQPHRARVRPGRLPRLCTHCFCARSHLWSWRRQQATATHGQMLSSFRFQILMILAAAERRAEPGAAPRVEAGGGQVERRWAGADGAGRVLRQRRPGAAPGPGSWHRRQGATC